MLGEITLNEDCALIRMCVRVLLLFVSSLLDLGLDEDDDEPVPLPNVNGAIMRKVIECLMCISLLVT